MIAPPDDGRCSRFVLFASIINTTVETTAENLTAQAFASCTFGSEGCGSPQMSAFESWLFLRIVFFQLLLNSVLSNSSSG
jgi:hypothetical protein